MARKRTNASARLLCVASVPNLRECHTQAKSLDELMERIREAITLCLEFETVSISISSQRTKNPWIEFGGIFKDDPDFADIMRNIQAEREGPSRITES